MTTPLARWRETRDPRLGKVIVDEPVADAAAFAALEKLPPKKQAAALLEALGSSTAHVGALVAAVDKFARSRKFAWPVIEKIADLDADPRWAALAIALLADFERLPPKSAKLWRRLVDAVEQHGDAAFGAALTTLPPKGASDQVKTRIANVAKRLAAATTVPVDDATRAIWRDFLAARPAPSTPAAKPPRSDAAVGAELLAAIYDNPDDLGARAVYGDWLAGHDDPRGEFIQLQLQRSAGTLTSAGARRETALLRKHAREWLQPLTPRVRYHDDGRYSRVLPDELDVPIDRLHYNTFANGFVAQLGSCWAEGADLEAPIFATVRRALWLRACSPVMRSLREARVAAVETITRLPHPLELLRVDYLPHVDLASVIGVPSLDVGVDSGGETDWSGLFRNNPGLESLTVRWGLRHAWGRVLHPSSLAGAPALREVTLTDGRNWLTLRRHDATAWQEVQIGAQLLLDHGIVAPPALAGLGPDGGLILRARVALAQADAWAADRMRVALAPFASEVVIEGPR